MSSIFYLSRVNLLTRRAHLHNIAKTCEAMRANLVTTFRNLNPDEMADFLKEHQIVQIFPVITLNSFSNRFQWSRFRVINWLEVILENFSLIRFLLFSRKEIDIIYFRDEHIFLAVIFGKYFLRKIIFFEPHAAKKQGHTQFLLNLMARLAKGVIAISWEGKKYYEKFNKNIMMAFCWAAEKENFPYHKSKIELRKELDLPSDKIIIGYTGRLDFGGVHSSYEIDKVIKALDFLSPNILFLIIGANKKDIEEIGEKPNLKVLPRISRLKIPPYLLAFDILVIPKLGDLPGNSPAKMFDYLASQRPIVAAETKPVNEVLHHEENALLVSSNEPRDWAKAIQRLIGDKALAERISRKAFEDSGKYTWQKRGQAIVDFLRKN